MVIALGGNDWYTSRGTVEYQAHLTELVTQVRLYVPTARVILWHYYQIGLVPDRRVCDVAPCTPVTPAPTWTQYGTAMRNVAVLLFTGYIDNSVEQQWLTRYPLPNENPRVHLSYLGHRALEQSIYTRLYNCC